jgi:hypothetical protein
MCAAKVSGSAEAGKEEGAPTAAQYLALSALARVRDLASTRARRAASLEPAAAAPPSAAARKGADEATRAAAARAAQISSLAPVAVAAPAPAASGAGGEAVVVERGGGEAATESGTRRGKREGQATAGKMWFDMPRGELTAEAARDLRALQMRNWLDPRKRYKTRREDAARGMPTFFQVGTVQAGALEKQTPRSGRGGTVLDDLMADARVRRYTKAAAQEAQARGQAGGRHAYRKRARAAGIDKPAAKRRRG